MRLFPFNLFWRKSAYKPRPRLPPGGPFSPHVYLVRLLEYDRSPPRSEHKPNKDRRGSVPRHPIDQQ